VNATAFGVGHGAQRADVAVEELVKAVNRSLSIRPRDPQQGAARP